MTIGTVQPRRRRVLRAGLQLAGLATLAGTLDAALAQPARPKVAVLSLFGTDAQVLTRKPAIGTNLSRPETQIVPMGNALDLRALKAAERVLAGLQRPDPVLLTSTSPSLHRDQDRYYDGAVAKLPEAFVKAAREDGAAQMVVLTRHRGAAQFRVRDAWIGSGTIEGAGFYIDLVERLKDWQGMETRSGYLAGFAWLRVALVDLATLRVVGEQRIQGSRIVLQATGDGSLDPWGALNADDKLAMLEGIVADELARVLPELFGR